jgi:hypothetical protein
MVGVWCLKKREITGPLHGAKVREPKFGGKNEDI